MAFGKRVGGGRRIAPRLPIDIPASLKALDCSGGVTLIDVSSTGAKLRGAPLPGDGDDLWITVGPMKVFATVIWKQTKECGVTFDVPLTPLQIHQLRGQGDHARFMKVTPELRLAADDRPSRLAR
jgi:hypothetical protein